MGTLPPRLAPPSALFPLLLASVLIIPAASSSRASYVAVPPPHHLGSTSFGPTAARSIVARRASGGAGGGDDGGGGGDVRPAGSFFNPVPEGGDGGDSGGDGGGGDGGREGEARWARSTSGSGSGDGDGDGDADSERDSFDRSVEELMKRRRARPRASQPSTIGGVPTSEATGFGKPSLDVSKISLTKPSASAAGGKKKSFVGIGRPLNDVNNPEYDDQGYTLYADEETGEKRRVFEALVEYPCTFTMKIVGMNEGEFEREIVDVVAESCGVERGDLEHSVRRNGRWTSVTVQAPVKSAEMLYGLYERVDRDPRVKFKF